MGGGVEAAPIGERLTAAGAVAPAEIEDALAEQQRTGSRLGEILLAAGALRADQLAPMLAEQWALPWLDDGAAVAPDALAPELAWRLAVVPVQVDGAIRFATAELLNPLQVEELRAAAGHADLVVTTPQRVMELTTAAYREPGLARATDHLREHRPEASASRVLTREQKIGGAVAIAVVVTAFAVWPLGTATVLLAAATTYYLLNSLYKFKLAFDSLIPVSDEEVVAVEVGRWFDDNAVDGQVGVAPGLDERSHQVVALTARMPDLLDAPEGLPRWLVVRTGAALPGEFEPVFTAGPLAVAARP